MAAATDRSKRLFEEFLLLSGPGSLERMGILGAKEGPGTVKEFCREVMPIWKEALNNLFALLRITRPPFEASEQDLLFFRLVAELNNLLPIDYPFALALAKITLEAPERGLIISALRRRLIPGAHDLLNPKFAILITAETREKLKSERVISLFRFPEEKVS